MARLWKYLTAPGVLFAFGVTAIILLLMYGTILLEISVVWVLIAALIVLAVWGLWRLWRRARNARASSSLAEIIAPQDAGQDAGKSEVALLRKNLRDAVATIKGSKLGLLRGSSALYELPWYMIIGNPAAGKSSAIINSGLTFPIPGSKAMQGVGGTRNCDWFFTTDGILLDTAGRYSVQSDDRAEWFSFLELLRRHRRRAPINGILIAVSVAELLAGPAKVTHELAKSLRTRVQELTERLGVHAPVYVIFTKVDLVAGFLDFFERAELAERERIWGATLRYNRRSLPQDGLAAFDLHFDELVDGLKEISLAGMGANRSAPMRPGVFTFPLEFSALKTPLRAFLATLFEENTYQFKPMFRGFYFTSALQEGGVQDLSSQRVAGRFGLVLREPGAAPGGQPGEHSGYFLLDLFKKVIFADRDLVRRYTRPTRMRWILASFFCAVVLLGGAMGGWAWSTMGNRQLLADVRADLEQVVKHQSGRIDLQSRMEALELLQDRIEQLEHYQQERPWALSFGLYQGEAVLRKLRDEYFAGLRAVMVEPVAGALETMLEQVNARAAGRDAGSSDGVASAAGLPYQNSSPASVEDAYKALKTYLMLGNKEYAEPGHLNDQLTRYWRGWLETNRGTMPREQMIRSAERLLSFYLARVDDQAWPQIPLKLGLLDTTREHLRRVVRGTPAQERVYADIRTRAATRFAAVTVARIVGEQDSALVAGSHAVSGAFTRAAWEQFVKGAIREASDRERNTVDWVLRTNVRDDLTLEGNPEQIQKALIDRYHADYAREWGKFLQGITIAELKGFDASVQAMNRLGDPQNSPIARVLRTIHEQTAWDQAPGARAPTGKTERGLMDWIREVVLRRAPSDVRRLSDVIDPVELLARQQGGSSGGVGREFAGVARLVGPSGKDASLMGGYLDALSRLRTRLNQIKNQGDPGPGAKLFMQQTLEGSGSELAEVLRYVDEQMLVGMSDAQRQVLRPLLVRPLTQTFAMIVLPTEEELNRTWQAQVLERFNGTLGSKYPFMADARVEATSAEIGALFGPEGAVAKFVNQVMGPLVVRRGDVLSARTWADLGIAISPQVVTSFPGWVAPLSNHGVATGASDQTVFQVLPLPAPGALEYTLEIDGQQLRYRNTPPAWVNMIHPGPQGISGARVTAIAFDGRSVDVFNQPGQFGLLRLFESAQRTRKNGGVHELRWSAGNISVAVDLKIISGPQSGASGQQGQGFRGMRLPQQVVGRQALAAANQASVGGP